MAMLALNVLSAPVAVVGTVTTATITITATAITAVLFVSCDKETEKHQQEQPQPQPQKHNVELVYGNNVRTTWQNISRDTLYKYNADPTVDTIFVIPERSNQFSTWPTENVNYLVDTLRDRHNINPNKIFGKGEMQLSADAVRDRTDLVVFLRDTMLYNVTYDRKKNR